MIVKTKGVCGGAARIKGTRIRVADIIRWIREGFSKEEIAKELSISVKDVEEALKYYKKHKKEIDKLIAEEDILFEIASRSKLTGGRMLLWC